MHQVSAYIIAARRTALGRVGGLHRGRRIDALAGPVVEAVLADAHIKPTEVDENPTIRCLARHLAEGDCSR